MSDPIIPPPQQIAMVSPSGEMTAVSPAEAQTFVALGYKPDSPELRAQMQREATAASPIEDAKAFAAGTARGATLGLSDLALTKTGLVDPSTLKTLRDDHPGSTLAGEFTGVLSPIGANALVAKAVGTGAKALGGAAKIATAPSALVTGAGEAIEAGVGKLIANQTAAKILGMGARGAAESLAYNVGNNISESALGDYELTAEKLLAHSGEAALLGGGLGLGVGVAIEGTRALFEKARAAGKGAAAIAADEYAKGVSKLTGADEAETAKLLAKPFDPETAAVRKETVDKFISPAERNRIHTQLTENFTALHDGTEEAKRFVSLKRTEETARLAADVEATSAVESLGQWIDKARTKANAMNADPIMHSPIYARELNAIADEAEKKLLGEGVNSAAEVFRLADDIKKTPLSDLSEWKKNLGNADRAVQNSVREVRSLYSDLKLHLENPANYGEAAARQQSINGALSELFDVEKNDWRKYVMRKTGVGSYEVDSEKVNRVLNRIGSERDRHMVDTIERYQAAASRLIDEAEKTALATDTEFSGAGMRSLIKKTQGLQAEAADKLAATSQIRAQDAFGMALKSWLGDLGLNGGVIGTAANVVGGAASPFTVAKTLSRLESGVLAADRVVDSAIKNFSSPSAKSIIGKAAAREVDGFVDPIMRQRVGDDERQKKLDPQQATKKAVDHFTQVAADPFTAADQIAKRFSKLDGVAPQTKQRLVETQLRVATFLATKVPKNPFYAYPGMQWEPSDSELTKFQRYVEAASNPLAVLENMSTGFVTVEQAEAVKQCYPKLFADIQMKFAERAPEIRKNSTYDQRLALSRMFGVAIDPTAEPAFTAWMQARFQPAEDGPKPRGGGESKSVNAGMSPSEARAARQAE